MKTITIGDIEYGLTPEKIRRLKEALKDTQRTLDRQMERREEHRDQKLVDFCKDHIKKLEGFLEGAEE